jgi:membrane-associated phospholipid phosphatase
MLRLRVPELSFDIELIRFLADHRTDLLTSLFQFFTFLGQTDGYILIVSLVYVAFDKRLAYRLAVLVLATMSLNHLLKMIIENPRPFVAEGTYREKWAVPESSAAFLATEYSTPSGHAMAGSAFYAYLYASVKSRPVRSLCIALILLTGLSRPYLGVHYLEDVLLGWVLGTAIAILCARYAAQLGRFWRGFSLAGQAAIVAAASFLLWLATRALGGSGPEGEPLAFIGYVGFLMGVVVAHPLELQTIDFDPRSGSAASKALRFVLGVGMVIGALVLLDPLFAALADDYSVPGYLLRYLRYTAAGFAGIYLAPLLFVKLGLAERAASHAPNVEITGARSP